MGMPAYPYSTSEGSYATAQKTGRWSWDEKLLFLYGLRRYGKGRWKKISNFLPRRSLVQIKSHAQKVLKRFEMGENLFLYLEEHKDRVEELLNDLDEYQKSGTVTPPLEKEDQPPKKTEQILAASALVSLAAPSNSASV